MNTIRPLDAGRPPRRHRAPAALAGMLGLAPLGGCATTRTIPAEQLPAVVAPAGTPARQVVVIGDDGKPIELPSSAHLRWVRVETRQDGNVDEFEPPVAAKVTKGGVSVEGKGASRTYPLSEIRSVEVRHDDHRADTRGGIALLVTGGLFATGAAVTATLLVATIKDCEQNNEGFEMGCLWMMGPGMGAGVGALVGIGLTIPGGVLLHRGLSGKDLPPAGQTGDRPAPRVVIGPGSAALTVPF